MRQIQTTRDHDKDMLIAGFKSDLAKAQAEIERLRAALRKLADWPQGRVFSAGFAPDDAEDMQEAARAALDEQSTEQNK